MSESILAVLRPVECKSLPITLHKNKVLHYAITKSGGNALATDAESLLRQSQTL